MKKCPICNGKLDQETFYNELYEDTSYYNFCQNCDWDDYPEEALIDYEKNC